MDGIPAVLVDQAEWSSFFDELSRESDRATAILAAAWIDRLLQLRLQELFAHGNSKARAQLFDANGPFATFGSKIAAAYCIGWLDADVHHDLGLIRRIRNAFAHQIHGLSMDSPEIRSLVDSFRVPQREVYDWGELRAFATRDGHGVLIFTGDVPEDAGEPLVLPAIINFRLAASWVIAYVAANLDVGLLAPGPDP